MVWGSGRLASRSIRNICFSLSLRHLSGQPELILVGDVAIAEKSAFASAVVEDRQQRAQEKGKREVLELGGHLLLCFLSLARFASIVVAAPGFVGLLVVVLVAVRAFRSEVDVTLCELNCD